MAPQRPYAIALDERPLATQLSQCREVLRTAGVGHFDPFPPPRLNGRCPFSEPTSAGASGNGNDAPILLKNSLSAMFDFLGGLWARHSKNQLGDPANLSIRQRARSAAGLRWY